MRTQPQNDDAADTIRLHAMGSLLASWLWPEADEVTRCVQEEEAAVLAEMRAAREGKGERSEEALALMDARQNTDRAVLAAMCSRRAVSGLGWPKESVVRERYGLCRPIPPRPDPD